MNCGKCGKEVSEGENFCPNCGAALREQPKDDFLEGAEDNIAGNTNGFAIAGFVCSFFIGLLGLIFSIIAMQQCREKKENGYGLAKAGMIISIVTIALPIVYGIVSGIVLFSVFTNFLPEVTESFVCCWLV